MAFLFPDGMLYVILRLSTGLEPRTCFAHLLSALPVGRGAWGLGEAGDLPFAAPDCTHPPVVICKDSAQKQLVATHREVCMASTCKHFTFHFFSTAEDQFNRVDIPMWMPRSALLPAARGDSGSCHCGDVRTPSPESPPTAQISLSQHFPVSLESLDLSEMGPFCRTRLCHRKSQNVSFPSS